jgi:hypothetical protein
MHVDSPSVRRPFIYPHRSARMLPRVRRRFAGAAVASAALTFAVWHFLESLLLVHNAIAFTLLAWAGIADVAVMDTAVFGRPMPVIVPTGAAPASWISYLAAGLLASALGVLAVRVPLARGCAAFGLIVLGAAAAAYALDAPGLRRAETFPVAWTHTELLVWLVLPSIAALLFVTVQPSWGRGLCWMAAIEAFAIFWSAARFVVIIGAALAVGPPLLPPLWFAWGLLADVLYVTTCFSVAVSVNLHLTPERR